MLKFAGFLFGFFLIIWGGISSAMAEKRVALVIGNSAYEHAPALKNPGNDAAAISKVLEKLGFDVVIGIDLSHASFAQTVNQFRKKLQGADVGLFFYAGHGLQVHGRNYLAPTDAELENETSLNFEAIPLHVVLNLMERTAKTNLVFLDACRDNPLARNLARSMGTRSTAIGRGLAREETGLGTMISFATQPGNVALDGHGKNSPFATGMLKHIETPGMDVALVMRRVREDVIKETSGSQVPWSNSSLTGSFVFKDRPKEKPKPVAKKPVVNTPAFDPKSMELSFWDSIRNGGNPALFREYLRRYPDGTFTPIAHAKLEELEAAKSRDDERKVAALPQAVPAEPDSSSESVSPLEGRDLAKALQSELERVKCYTARIDGDWGRGSQAALRNFNRYAKLNLDTSEPTVDALDAVKGKTERVCPLTCGVQYRVQGERCVKKTCLAGQRLNSRGQCIKVVVKKVNPPSTAKKKPRKKTMENEYEECAKKWGLGACTAFGLTIR